LTNGSTSSVTVSARPAAAASGDGTGGGGCGIGGVPPATGHALIKSVQAQGTDTVVFTLTGPANPVWFELNGLGQILPMPKAVWDRGSYREDLALQQKLYNDPTAPEFKVVSGPYKFKNMVPNEFYTFVPNEAYGGHKATVTWIEQYETSDSAEFAALKRGQVDAGYLTPTMFSSASELKGQDKKTLSIGDGSFGWYGISLNSAPDALDVGTAFQDLKVREALQYGIDENALGKVLYGQGLYIPSYSAIPAGFPGLTKAVFGVSAIPAPYPYDPKKGREILEQDGWHLNAQGVMQKGPIELKFPALYQSGSTEWSNAAVIFQHDWAKMGVQITPEPVDFGTIMAMSDTQPGDSAKWAMALAAQWGYEPDYYPTGAGMWNAVFNPMDDFKSHDLEAKIASSYLPGTAAQVQHHMYDYALATARDLPVLWMPEPYGVNETAYYVHGMNKYFNPVAGFTLMNYVTISH
jgi:peptide/nickel transport system substrate-binding protein